jgi:alkylation response protein AidB-like acyl-CoA dehydrogenase
MKKWISNGIFSDYMTVAVRTGGGKSKFIEKIIK